MKGRPQHLVLRFILEEAAGALRSERRRLLLLDKRRDWHGLELRKRVDAPVQRRIVLVLGGGRQRRIEGRERVPPAGLRVERILGLVSGGVGHVAALWTCCFD